MNFTPMLFTIIPTFSFVFNRFFINLGFLHFRRFFSSWLFSWNQGQIYFLVFLSIIFIRGTIRLRLILYRDRFFLKYVLSFTDIPFIFFTFVHIAFKLTLVSASWTRFSSTKAQLWRLLEVMYLYIPGRVWFPFFLPIYSIWIPEIIRKNIIYKHIYLLNKKIWK